MEDQKYNLDQMRKIVDFECLDLALLHCVESDDIEDKELANMWGAAQKAMRAIVKKLGLDY
jgi:hypothetical protein